MPINNTTPLLELFHVDASIIVADTHFYFVNAVDTDGSAITFDGDTYEPFPIIAKGFEKNIEGRIPEPEITVSNANNYISDLALALNGFRGCKVTRRRIHYSDLANPLLEFTPDVYYIGRYTENALAITFYLKSVLDRINIKLPKRRLINLVTS